MADKGKVKLNWQKGPNNQRVSRDYGKNARTKPTEPSRAKKRWLGVLGRITATHTGLNAYAKIEPDQKHENLIDEIKRLKKQKEVSSRKYREGGVLAILQARHETENKFLEKQKFSAKERIMRRRGSVKNLSATYSGYTLADYDTDARLRYPITSEIRIKLEKIKKEAEKDIKDQKKGAPPKNWFQKQFQRFVNWFVSTNLGETIQANHRFYRFNPHDHLPELCRRCRRPLSVTLEARFTSIGILFCILLPLVGILLLYANREFVCVVCDELYFYGDLTARPEEEDYEEGDDEIF